jgi:NAD(P) transhydrogenase
MRQYDLAVIGTGPAGQRAAIQGAKLGKRVVAIEESDVVGGAQINTGTIPSKALREAAMHLTGRSTRGLFGESYRVKRDITVSDLISVSRQVIHNELDVVRDAFDRNGIDLLWGHAEFIEPQLLQVSRTGNRTASPRSASSSRSARGPRAPQACPSTSRTSSRRTTSCRCAACRGI